MGIFSRFERTAENAIEGVADRFSNAPVSPAAIAKKAEKKMHSQRMVGSGVQYAPTLYTVLVNPQDDRVMMGYYPTLSGELESLLSAKAAEANLIMDGTPLVRFIADNSLKAGKFEVIAETVAAPIVEQLRDDELQRYGITRGRYEAALARKRERQQAEAREARREELRQRSEQMEARGGRFSRGERGERGGRGEGEGAPRGMRGGRNRGEGEERTSFQNPFRARAQREAEGFEDERRADVPPFAMPPVQDLGYGSEPGPDGKRRLPYVPEDEIDRSIDYGEYTFNSLNFDDVREQDAAAAAAALASKPAPAPEPEPEPDYAPVAPAPAMPDVADFEPEESAPAAAPRGTFPPQRASRPFPPQDARPQQPAAAPVAPAKAPYIPVFEPPVSDVPAEADAARSAYREPISFTPAPRIAPEAKAMPAEPIPGVLAKEQDPGTMTVNFADEAEVEAAVNPAPATLPYTDLKKPMPRYRIRNLQDGRSYTLTGTRVYIGRESTCNIVVADPNASRRHAELRTNGKGVWTITDMESTNGTFLNGEQITSAVLVDGDRITVGTTDLVFVVC